MHKLSWQSCCVWWLRDEFLNMWNEFLNMRISWCNACSHSSAISTRPAGRTFRCAPKWCHWDCVPRLTYRISGQLARATPLAPWQRAISQLQTGSEDHLVQDTTHPVPWLHAEAIGLVSAAMGGSGQERCSKYLQKKISIPILLNCTHYFTAEGPRLIFSLCLRRGMKMPFAVTLKSW